VSISYASGNAYLSNVVPSQTSISKAFANAVQAGSLLVAVQFWSNTDEVQTFSDNNGNTWIKPIAQRWHSNLSNGIAIAYAVNANAGATTVTCSSTSTISRDLVIIEILGAATVSPVDGTPIGNEANGSTSNPDPGAITTAGAGIILGVAVIYPTDNPTAGTSYTSQYHSTASGSLYNLAIEDFITSGAQTNNHASWATAEDYWLALGVAFKAAASGGATTTKVMSETLTLADATVNGVQRPRVQSEALTIIDATIPYRRLVRVPQEALTLADSIVPMRRLRRVVDEGITLADAFNKTVSGSQVITTKVMSEALTLADGFVDWLRRVRLQTDTTLITEDNTTRTFIITGEDLQVFVDELVKWRRLKRVMDEPATFTDAFSKSVASPGATTYTKVLTETVTLSDAALDRVIYRRVAEDSQVFADSKVQYSSAGVFGPPAVIAKVVRYVGVLP